MEETEVAVRDKGQSPAFRRGTPANYWGPRLARNLSKVISATRQRFFS
jgi:hypothetical protein